MIRIIQAVFLLTLLTGPGYATDETVDNIKAAVDKVNVIEQDVSRGAMSVAAINDTVKQLNDLKIEVEDCLANTSGIIEEKKAALDELGEAKRGEPAEVKKQRRELEQELSGAESRMSNCTALKLRIETISEELEAQRKTQLSEELFAKNPHVLKIIASNLAESSQWWTSSIAYASQHAWINTAPAGQIALLLVSIIIGIAAGVFLRSRTSRCVAHFDMESSLGSRVVAGFMSTACRDSVYILGSLLPAIYLASVTQGIKPLPLVSALAYGLTFFFIVRLIIRATLDPATASAVFKNIAPEVGHALSQRLNVLLFVIVAGYVLINSILAQSLPDHTRQLAETILRLIFAINVVWVLWLFRHLTGVLGKSWFRFGLSLVLVIGMVADLVGYTNLAGWLFRAVFGSLLAVTLVLLTRKILSELLIGLEYGRNRWQQTLRASLGLDGTGRIQGFFWIRLIVNLCLLLLLVWLLILIWDLSENAVQQLDYLFTQGFTIGSLKVVPSRILVALLSLGVLVAVSAWIKGRLLHNLETSPMERGAREAMVTIVGYAGTAIAIIVALGIAGLDFSSLAIIAGALSVGIGFGLQNIVNNFISGLILLFERPVKTGDWIVVGDTEGYVKRIRIRSTQIQTFDRADVIVPNSELISGQVTNWMLHDAMGRAVIPVGVAYGSDTQKVKDILLQVANDHPEVMSGGAAPEPYVLFREFGDSSLNFELRCYIENIDHRFSVISDLNFAIDAAFRDNGIEIPFPQRDLHVRDWPGKPENE